MKRPFIVLMMLLLALPLSAYSGMGDQMMDQIINLVAAGAVILSVQLLLWLIFGWTYKKTRYAQKLHERGVKVCSGKYRSIFVFMVLFSFVAAPYSGILSSFTMGLIWAVAFIFFCMVISVRKLREKCLSPKGYAILINLSIAQVLGLMLYAPVCGLPVFRKIFYYNSGEIPELEFYSYAGSEAYIYLLITMLTMVALILVPVILSALLDGIRDIVKHLSH